MSNPTSLPSSQKSILRHIPLAVSIASLVACATLASAAPVTSYWLATPTDANWVTTPGQTNWDLGPGNFPGSTTSMTNTDVAGFNTTSTQMKIIINSPTLNVGGITFDTPAGAAYTIGDAAGNSLFLTGGGAIDVAATAAETQNVNAPLVITGNGGNYSFINNATATSVLLNIGGSVTGGSGAGIVTTVTLDGSNTATSGFNGDFVTRSTVSGSISDGGAGGQLAVVKTGNGNWLLSGANSYSGGTTVSAGQLGVSNAAALGSGDVNVAAGAQLAFTSASINVVNNITLNGITTGNGAIGNGTIVGGNLSGQNTNVMSGTVTLASTSNFSTTYGDKSLEISGKVTGPGGLQLDQYNGGSVGSVLTLSNVANDYAGGTRINYGTLNVATIADGGTASSIGASSSDPNNLYLGGTLNYTGPTVTTDRGFVAAGGGIRVNDAAANLTFTGQGLTAAISKTGPGTLTLAGTADNISLNTNINEGTVVFAKDSNSNVHAVGGGATTLNGGTLQLAGSGDDQIYTGNTVNVNSGTFDLNGRNEGFSALNGSAGVVTNTATATNSTLTVGENNANGSFSGKITDGAGTVGLTKVGSGTQVLSSSNTYSGATNINEGTLRLQGAGTAPLAGSSLWIDPSDTSTVTLNGQTVSAVADKSGSGRTATQSDPAQQPGYGTNPLFNGLNVLHFTGNPQVLNVDLSFLANSSYTIFTIEGRNTTTNNNNYFLGTLNGSPNNGLHFGYRNDTDFTLAQYATDIDTGVPAFTTQMPRLWEGQLNTDAGGGHSIYLNGTQVASNNNTTPFSSQIGPGVIGQGFSGSGSQYAGDLGEILIYNTSLSAADRQQVEAYLSAKWLGIGTVGNILPANTAVNIGATGTLDLNGISQTIGSLSGSADTSTVLLGAGSLTIGQNGTSTSYAGTISGTGGRIVKEGLGTLSLTGNANSYTGGTTIAAGAIVVGSANGNLGSGNVSVLNGAGANLTIQTGVLDAIADTATLTLEGGGMAGLADNGFLTLESGVNEVVNALFFGTAGQGPGTYGSSLSSATFKSDEYFSGSGILTVAIPEPGSLSLALTASGIALGLVRRRRRA